MHIVIWRIATEMCCHPQWNLIKGEIEPSTVWRLMKEIFLLTRIFYSRITCKVGKLLVIFLSCESYDIHGIKSTSKLSICKQVMAASDNNNSKIIITSLRRVLIHFETLFARTGLIYTLFVTLFAQGWSFHPAFDNNGGLREPKAVM